jgi:small subunit ribosomal protein S13
MSKDFRFILRFMGTDLDGSKRVIYGISKVRGVGPNLAQAIVKVAKVNPDARIGSLSEAEMSRVEDAIRDPLKFGIPTRMVNRRKDIETGRDMHLVGADLALKIKSDVDLMKDIKSWKGVRHTLGLKVRGQRTRTTGRSGKAVGVKKKVLMEAARAAEKKPAAEEKK